MSLDKHRTRKSIIFWTVVLIITCLITFTGCKTKHKIIEREKEVIQTRTHETVNELIKKDIKIDSFAKKGSNSISIKSIKIILLTQADSSKTISIKDGNGNSLTVKGADLVINNTETLEKKQDSSLVKLVKADNSVNKTTSEKTDNSTSKKVKRKSDSDVKTTSTWLWVVIGLGLVFFIYRFN